MNACLEYLCLVGSGELVMIKKKSLIFMTVLLVVLSIPAAASGHGVNITYQKTNAIEITAVYDTGEPLSEGQVTVYAPDNPSTPWVTGKVDEQGRFTFTPDPSKPGTWDVQVRKAGHGGMIHIPVGGGEVAAASTGYKTSQIVLMAACVVWGLVGTALFFKRGKS